MANIGGYEGRVEGGVTIWKWFTPADAYSAPGEGDYTWSATKPNYGPGEYRVPATSTSKFILDDPAQVLQALAPAALLALPALAPLVESAAAAAGGGAGTIFEGLTTGGAVSIFDDIGDVFEDVTDVAGAVGDLFGGSGGDVVYGDDGGGSMVQTGIGGAIGSAVVGGGIWLGQYLTRALGAGASSAIYTAANGVRVRLVQLWPLIRRYGPQAVAGALGISVAALGTLALQAPRGGTRRRRRGISSRDIKTTRRVVGFVNKMQHQIGCVSTKRKWKKG